MIRNKVLILLIFLNCSLNCFATTADDFRVIYGEDDREEFYQINDPFFRALFNQVVVIHDSNKSEFDDSLTMQKRYNICDSEKFNEQNAIMQCTGLLISSNRVITAGHCVPPEGKCDNLNFIFDYYYTSESVIPLVSPNKSYKCKKILRNSYLSSTIDLAVVELERDVDDRLPSILASESKLNITSNIAMVGSPLGIPLKLDREGKIFKESNYYWSANLDSFTGNSGSPIFNSYGEAEGILVAGAPDFYFDEENKCNKINICDENCSGERILKIPEVLDYILDTDLEIIEKVDDKPSYTPSVFINVNSENIDDYGGNTLKSSIDINELPDGRKVLIGIEIEHSSPSDLVVSLTSPSGASYLLYDRGITPNSNKLTGIYGINLTSVDSLRSLENEIKTGEWYLYITDIRKENSGILKKWSVIFK